MIQPQYCPRCLQKVDYDVLLGNKWGRYYLESDLAETIRKEHKLHVKRLIDKEKSFSDKEFNDVCYVHTYVYITLYIYVLVTLYMPYN